MKQARSGYIALITVLITGAVSLAIAVTLLAIGTDAQRSNLVVQSSIQARQLANGCVEEALQKIHDSSSFTGTGIINLSTGTCSYTVVSTGASTRTINTSSTINGVVRKAIAYATINLSNISITSWQEVS
jgi:hypothetical protein